VQLLLSLYFKLMSPVNPVSCSGYEKRFKSDNEMQQTFVHYFHRESTRILLLLLQLIMMMIIITTTTTTTRLPEAAVIQRNAPHSLHNKKLSSRKETARRSMSLEILLSYSRSYEIAPLSRARSSVNPVSIPF